MDEHYSMWNSNSSHDNKLLSYIIGLILFRIFLYKALQPDSSTLY